MDLRRRPRLDASNPQDRAATRVVAVPAGQAWFWSERWQRMEREAEADVAAGRVVRTDSFTADWRWLSDVKP